MSEKVRPNDQDRWRLMTEWWGRTDVIERDRKPRMAIALFLCGGILAADQLGLTNLAVIWGFLSAFLLFCRELADT